MKSRIVSVILSVILFSQICFAQLCAKLVDARCGENHTLALSEDGVLFSCGGGDGSYAMGLGDSASNVLSLKRVLCGEMNTISGYTEDVISFDAGWEHSLIVTQDGYCWSVGDDSYGKLGNGSSESSSSVPIKVHGLNNSGFLQNIVKVSAGRSGRHSLALNSSGYPMAWGLNDSYQCGDNTNTNREYPGLVYDSDPNTTGRYLGDEVFIVDIEAGVSHSLALTSRADGGIIFEWGDGYDHRIPHRVSDVNGVGYLSNIVDIATCYQSLGVDANGYVYYWTTGSTPSRISGGGMGTQYLQNIKKVAAGYNDLCAALDANENIWEWFGSSGSPVKVVDGEQNTSSGYLEGITNFDVGYYNFRVTIDKYGYGWSWCTDSSGYSYGQLGVGNTDSHSEPTEMLCAEISPSVEFELSYEIGGLEPNCAKPFIGWGIDDNYLVYSITYANPITNPSDPNYVGTLYDVNIVNELPLEMEYYASDPCGVYDANKQTISWHIGDLSPGEEGVLTFTVKVNDYAKPCGTITDFAHLIADGYYTYDDVNVPICPWGGDIIYVNDDANGFNNGTSWTDAYISLQDAFTQAQNSCATITAIWVAGGTYKPIYDMNEDNYQNVSFELIDGVALIGGFAGDETSADQRDFSDSNSEAVLDGRIGDESYETVYNVVTAEDMNTGFCIIDGFTIKNASQYGMKMDSSTVGIENCKFKNNSSAGIYATDYSYADIYNCLFMNNSSYGISANASQPDISYCVFDGNDITSQGLYLTDGSGSNITNSEFENHTSNAIQGYSSTITISDSNISLNGTAINGSSITVNLNECKIYQNSGYGVDVSDATLNCTKTIFEDNTDSGIKLSSYSVLDIENSVIRNSGNYGIYLSYNLGTQIFNNWIYGSGLAGIYLETQRNVPFIRNCTIYGNGTYGIERNSDGQEPNIMNCIIFDNDTNDIYRPSGTFSKVRYCLLQRSYTGAGNIIGDPCFANSSNENDLHISEYSICKDAGNPNITYSSSETDIDDEARIRNSRIDIGADECYFYTSPADYDDSGIVNWLDYRYLAQDWKTRQSNYSLDDDNDVDVYDLSLFCADWLCQNSTDGDGWMLWTSETETLEVESLSLSASLLSVESDSETTETITSTVDESTSLMLTTVAESIVKQPTKLAARSKKFYSIRPPDTITDKQRELESLKAERIERMRASKSENSVVDVNAMVDWLENLWATDSNVSSSIDANDWQEFLDSIESSE